MCQRTKVVILRYAHQGTTTWINRKRNRGFITCTCEMASLRMPHVHGDDLGRVPCTASYLSPPPLLVPASSIMAGVVPLKSGHSPSALNPATVPAADLSAPSVPRQATANEVLCPSFSCHQSLNHLISSAAAKYFCGRSAWGPRPHPATHRVRSRASHGPR